MVKKISIIMLLALCLWGVLGSTVLAADPSTGGLVTCGKETTAASGKTLAQTQAESCNFAAAVEMINKLITYLIYIALPLAAVAFAYAGWLYLSAGEDSGKVTKARGIFASVGVGFIIILSGWLVFKLIETTFLSGDYKTYLN